MTAARNNWFEDYLEILSESPDEFIATVENSNPSLLENVPDLLENVPTLMMDAEPTSDEIDIPEDGVTISSYSSTKQSSTYVPFLFFTFMKTIMDV